MAELDPLLDSQIAMAKGLRHLYMKTEDGRWVEVKDPAMFAAVMNSGDQGTSWDIWSKDPDVRSYLALTEQTFDKPMQRAEVSGPQGGVVPISVIHKHIHVNA